MEFCKLIRWQRNNGERFVCIWTKIWYKEQWNRTEHKLVWEQDIGHEPTHIHTYKIHSHCIQAQSQRLRTGKETEREKEMCATERSVAQKQRSECNLVNTCLIKLAAFESK